MPNFYVKAVHTTSLYLVIYVFVLLITTQLVAFLEPAFHISKETLKHNKVK